MRGSLVTSVPEVQPVLRPPADARFGFQGFVGRRIRVNQENWLLPFPEANPNVLQMFRDRDRCPRSRLIPCAGEYPGKYLIGAVQCWLLTRDQRLHHLLDRFVADLIAVQDEDGYLGPHPRSERLTGRACPSEGREGDYLDRWGVWGGPLWDLWGHYHNPTPRWESIPNVQAIAELYYVTGEKHYRRAFEHIWWSILRGDRHNTGGFSSHEQATGNPFDRGPIETCCTVAWMALSVDMLRLTGDPVVADELELSTFNATFGSQHPSGRWWTYNTPMDGERRAFVHDHNWQCRPGGPELNCCQTNAARGLGMLSEWAILTTAAGDGCVVNYYGQGEISIRLPGARGPVKFVQTTSYPRDGKVSIRLVLEAPVRFTLRLRIPQWSYHTRVAVNGQPVGGVAAGTYLALEKTWQDGDCIALHLDMSLHFWPGDRECRGLVSIYRGPILLTYDQRFNTMDPDDLPALDVSNLQFAEVEWEGAPSSWLLLRFSATDGRELFLCDFASAGASGTRYCSWLSVQGIDKYLVQARTCSWVARLRNG